jgi:hypothetical protein
VARRRRRPIRVVCAGGTWDLFARRVTGRRSNRIIRRNAITATAGATFNLDFATEGFAPEMRTVTFEGVSPSRRPSCRSSSATARRKPVRLSYSISAGNFFAIPAAQLRAGDYHSIVASASDPTRGGADPARAAARYRDDGLHGGHAAQYRGARDRGRNDHALRPSARQHPGGARQRSLRHRLQPGRVIAEYAHPQLARRS